MKLAYALEYETELEVAGERMAAVIVAAGSSSRMQGMQKQQLPLLGVPVLARTLLAFQSSEQVSKIVLVAREGDLLWAQQLLEQYHISKCTDLLAGGASRSQSVAAGIARLGSDTRYALIHDGARPLVSAAVIARVAEAARETGAAACAVKVKDTIKRVDPDGFVRQTLLRDDLVAMQTPQGFLLENYRDALAKAGDASEFTDDCALLEAAGYRVKIVAGDYKNIKITTPEDIAVATAYLREEGQE